jgi:peptidoglycan/LPS O-acetylase OafA/YrhL
VDIEGSVAAIYSMKAAFDNRNNNLDFLRLFFSVAVILSHSFPLGVGKEDTEPMMRLSAGQTTLGTLAVDSFFIISGFLITHSYMRSSSVRVYFRKRVERIYPGFVICMLICGLVVAPLAGAASPFLHVVSRMLNFAAATSFLHEFSYQHAFALNPKGAINGSVWSISYEFACYIAVAMLGVGGLLRRKGAISILFCLSLVSLVTSACLVNLCRRGDLSVPQILNHPLFWDKVLLRGPLVPAYLAGVVFYLYRERIPHNSVWAGISVCVLGLSCVTPGMWQLCFPVAGTYLLFWLGFHTRVQLHNFARFGDFSYGTYLYAFPIQQLLVQRSGGFLNPYLLFVVATPLSVLAAIASWHGVEKWFLSRARNNRNTSADGGPKAVD